MRRPTYEEAIRATMEPGYNDHLYEREALERELEQQILHEESHQTVLDYYEDKPDAYFGEHFIVRYADGVDLGVYARSFGEAWHIGDHLRPGHATKDVLVIH